MYRSQTLEPRHVDKRIFNLYAVSKIEDNLDSHFVDNCNTGQADFIVSRAVHLVS